MEKINIFNDVITIISFIMNLTLLLSVAVKIYVYFSKKRYVKKVLGFTKDTVQISNSTFHLITDTKSSNDFITYSSLKSINNVINLLNIIEKKFDLLNKTTETKNEINIGGFITNKKVNAYFTKYFPHFKFIINDKYKEVYDNYSIDKRIIEYSSKTYGFKIVDNFLETDSQLTDYAFLIKLTNSDFKNNKKKTVHILFGGGDIGTVKATEYLLTHYKEIYKKYKNNHYFFAIKVNRVDESIDYSKGIIDLTDKMFL
ncbi:MAG: hypothetical protein IJA10_10385 [Lachnospiraceae bacterium]|nr:hypothetical protein [Lachnospiraceae bacterium]